VSDIETLARNSRVTVRRKGAPDPEGTCVVYWMQRAQRASDNPALNVAIEAGNALRKPVVAFIALVPFYPNANLRHFQFFIEGFGPIASGLKKRGVGFVLRRFPDHELEKFCAEVRPSLVVGDENPMREPERWRVAAAEALRVPYWTVDADVIVPSKLLDKEQYAARTIRPRIRALLPEFLMPLGNPKARVAWKPPRNPHSLAPDSDVLDGLPIDRSVQPVSTFRGGTGEALKILSRFVGERLSGYAVGRSKPELDQTSQLSPYLHFGHIGPHTVALAVQKASAPWALRTLDEHRRDEREHTYSERQLENAETHDPLWNAAQKQMTFGGWMHGYVRMYWAKKILEWTRSPEDAFEIAVRLNDRYELDGRDPNGYTGIAWAIGGKHDRAWGPERPAYGKIRTMSYASTSRKFDSKAYIENVDALCRKGRTSDE